MLKGRMAGRRRTLTSSGLIEEMATRSSIGHPVNRIPRDSPASFQHRSSQPSVPAPQKQRNEPVTGSPCRPWRRFPREEKKPGPRFSFFGMKEKLT
jgi:hypothetical protein